MTGVVRFHQTHADEAPSFSALRRPLPLGDRTDRALHVGVTNGDEAAFGEIYRRHSSITYTIAVRLLRDAAAAEEVIQDCFVALWDHPYRFDPNRGELRPYLVRLTHSRAIDRLRSDTRRTAREDRHERERSGTDADIEREVWEIIRAEIVRDAMASLSPGERDALQLAYFEGLTQTEIAARNGDPLGTVKTRVRLALNKLAGLLGPGGRS